MTSTESTFDTVANRFFGAIEAGDIDTVGSMFTEDFTLWLTGAGGGNLDKAAALGIIAGMVKRTHDRHYEVLDRQPFDGGFMQQHRLHGSMLDGTPFSFRVAIIMRVNADGLFTHVDEYLDFTELGPLRPPGS